MYQNPLFDNGQIHQPALDVDAMLFEVSNRMARAQLARQISSSSSTFKQRASRILKTNSVGSSPQAPQRRRTVTTQTAPWRRSDMYHQGLQQSQQGGNSHNGHQSWSLTGVRPVSTTRPVSWHPTSIGPHRHAAHSAQSARISGYEVASRHSMAAYQTVAMNGLPTPMTQPDLNKELPVDPFFSLDNPAIPIQQPTMPMQSFDPAGLSLDTNFQPYIPLDQTSQFQYQIPTTNGYPAFSPMNYATQSWAESLSAFPSYTAPPTPEFLPIQNPSEIWQDTDTTAQPALSKCRSKELVGMGLYDHPDRNSFSLDNLTESHAGSLAAHMHHESLGKGLKLEETWRPPEDVEEEEEDDEDAESSEGDDHTADEIPPTDNGAHAWHVGGGKVQDALQPVYTDLSNQSFFFDGDTYFDRGAFAQQIPPMASNIHDLALQEYMWSEGAMDWRGG